MNNNVKSTKTSTKLYNRKINKFNFIFPDQKNMKKNQFNYLIQK